jgi:uncharacterized protein DUF4389
VSATPVTFTSEWVEPRSRLTTFFRWLLVIPHWIVLFCWGVAAFFAVVGAWFALVLTGRWPQGLYDFVASFLRYATFVNAYAYLLTDRFPPFSGEDPAYPVQLGIGPPKAEYSRLSAAFRLILYIPVYVISYALGIVAGVGVVLAWFAIVLLGRQIEGLQQMVILGISYQQRAMAYACLITEDWPPFTSPGAALTQGPADGTLGPGGPGGSGAFAPPQAPTPRASGGDLAPGDPLA